MFFKTKNLKNTFDNQKLFSIIRKKKGCFQIIFFNCFHFLKKKILGYQTNFYFAKHHITIFKNYY